MKKKEKLKIKLTEISHLSGNKEWEIHLGKEFVTNTYDYDDALRVYEITKKQRGKEKRKIIKSEEI